MKEAERSYVSRVSVCTGGDAFKLIGALISAVRTLVDPDALMGLRIEMEHFDGMTAEFVISADIPCDPGLRIRE